MEFYYADGDQQKGPLPIDQLRAAGVEPTTLVWREGMAQWTPAGGVAELTSLFQPAAFPYGQPTGGVQPGYAASFPGQTPQGVYPQQVDYSQPQGFGQQSTPNELSYGGYARAQGSSSNGFSTASLVLGVLAFPLSCLYFTGVISAILAIVFGHLGRSASKKANVPPSGMALAGLICGYVYLGLVAVGLIFFVAVLSNIH